MKKVVLFLVFFALFWSSITLVFDVMWTRALIGQARSLGFRAVPGRIISSEVTSHTDEGTTYGAAIRYTYRVGDHDYTSDRVRFGQMKTSDGQWARAAVAAFRADAACTVYHDPTDPANAVLQTSLNGQDLFFPLFLVPFNAVMVAIWWVLFLAWGRPPPAGGARITTLAHQVEVRFVDLSPAAAALAAMGFVAFGLIFVIGFTGGFSPPRPLMLVAWGVVFAAGVAGFYWTRRRFAGAGPDLLIYAGDGQLTRLRPPTSPDQPATWKVWRQREQPSTPPWVVPLERIRGVEMRERSHPSGDGTTYDHVVVLLVQATDPAGPVEMHDLAAWTLANRAEAFAAWLRELLGLPAAGQGRLP